MKKPICYLMMTVMAAGLAIADDGSCTNEPAAPQPPPKNGVEQGGRSRPGEGGKKEDWRQRAQEHHEKVNRLAKAAREETDPVKKEERVDELRAVLMEGAEAMMAHFRRRVEDAEQDVAEMRERLEDGEANMEARVEEYLQTLLTCEPPPWAGEPNGPKAPPGPPPEKPAEE